MLIVDVDLSETYYMAEAPIIVGHFSTLRVQSLLTSRPNSSLEYMSLNKRLEISLHMMITIVMEMDVDRRTLVLNYGQVLWTRTTHRCTAQ